MKPLHTRKPAPTLRPRLEALEDRTLLSATISIGDASAIEGSTAVKLLDRFVSEGSGPLRLRTPTFGPDGNGDGTQDLYVAIAGTNEIRRFDGRTGAFLDTFVAAGSGGLNDPTDPAFGPDGLLYVTSTGSGEVLRYDGSTGVFVDRLVSGLSVPMGLTFGSDGSLYIANQNTDEVLRYGSSGLSVFVSAGSGGLDEPGKAVFGPDGNLYVASNATKQVLRYNGATGVFLDVFATTASIAGGQGPSWLAFGADGYLYTTARNTLSSLDMSFIRFNAASGAFVDHIALGRDGWSFTIAADGLIYNSSNGAIGANFVDRLGPSSFAAFTVSLSSASATPVMVNYSTADVPDSAGSDDYIATSGTLTFAPGQTTRTILVQTLPDALIEGNETFVLNLSSSVGATIADSLGVATITDDDVTKFFVVNDGGPDRTYRYGVPGNGLGDSALDSVNTAPRGAAGNAAGDKLWVLDANKKVYVYDASGGLLGSWTAGSLNPSAQVEGVATNGTDVWIVDAKQDKVFRYTGAASRTSGSQNAASSFNLNSGNSNPKGIVTDGASLWVVNDSTTNKVFKYTLSGTLLGSWTIDSANASPTGITLDPTSPGHLWVVDNGTDRVYQYDNAVGRTSGSQSASASFALAAGNTNPQDIADPPAPGLFLTTSAVPQPLTDNPHSRDLAHPLSFLNAPSAGLPPFGLGADWTLLADPTPRSESEPGPRRGSGEPIRLDLLAVPWLRMASQLGDDLLSEVVGGTPADGPGGVPTEAFLADDLVVLDQVFADGWLVGNPVG